MSEIKTFLHNPDLAGAPFFLEGSGPNAVLLFHGFTSTCSEVLKLGKALHRLGFTVSGPLLAGHGTQPSDLNRVRWQDWAEGAEREYQDLKNKYTRVLVGGESTGGLVALYLAAEHPEIAAVLAYAPALHLPLKPWQRMIVPLLASINYHLPKNDLEGNTTWQGYRVNPTGGLRALLKLEAQVEKRLGQIQSPLLVVQGRKDRTIDPRSSEIVYAKAGSAVKELHWMEKSGHTVLLDEEAHQVNKLTIDFVFKVGANR